MSPNSNANYHAHGSAARKPDSRQGRGPTDQQTAPRGEEDHGKRMNRARPRNIKPERPMVASSFFENYFQACGHRRCGTRCRRAVEMAEDACLFELSYERSDFYQCHPNGDQKPVHVARLKTG